MSVMVKLLRTIVAMMVAPAALRGHWERGEESPLLLILTWPLPKMWPICLLIETLADPAKSPDPQNNRQNVGRRRKSHPNRP